MNPKILPEELFLQILARLPIKSIFKFKLVCKLWYNFLSESYFIKLYNEISIRNPRVLVEVSDSSKPELKLFCIDRLAGVSEIKLDFIKDRVEIRASCNGLLWCSSIPDKCVYYVCNPMTRQYKVLPRIKEELVNSFSYLSREPLFLGLVCDLFNHKFNVFLVGFRWSVVKRGSEKVCLMYDSETNEWIMCNSVQDDYFIHMNMNRDWFRAEHVYSNGSLYKLCEGDDRITFLDLKPAVVGTIPLPNEVRNEKGKNRAYMLEFDGLLSLVQIADAFLTIWGVKDKYIKKWEVVEKISSTYNITDIYRISQRGDYVFFATHKESVMYNRSTKVWTSLFSLRDDECTLPLWFMTHSFRSTLFSLYD